MIRLRPRTSELGSDRGTVKRVPEQLGYGVESVRAWVPGRCRRRLGPGCHQRGAGQDQGLGAGGAGAAPGECDLEVGVGFLRGGARPPTPVMVEFIDAHRGEFGVEPICRALQFAPSTYYDAKSRPESQRARRHRAMGAVLVSIWAANWRVYGARKLWVAARRAGHDIGRDQVARLMRAAGISGATRQRRVHTTKADPCAHRPGDLVRRDFTAAAPNRLWVTDLTVVPTRTGAAYVCLIVDAFSRCIVGWRVAAHMRTSMVLDALEMARRSRGAQLAWRCTPTPAARADSTGRSNTGLLKRV